jgi:MoaA/NifB/PqqE/SkfB family radical SAM enzyme
MLTGVHILLTYQCTHECDHCFVYSSPRATGTFTIARIRDLLDQAKRTGSVAWIYFEGGEPFLFYALMVRGLKEASERGFRTGVVTNAYWAKSVEDAEVCLQPLKELGVEDLVLSDDAFHHASESDNPARRAKEAAGRLSLPVGTICIPQPEEAEGVRFRGRAADKLTEGRVTHPAREFTECPDEDLRDPGRVHVDAFGDVHLCQGLLMGNVWETPLPELLKAYDPDRHPIAGPLLRGGPARLAEKLGIDREEPFVSACHLCYRARESVRGRFPRHLGPGQVYGREK